VQDNGVAGAMQRDGDRRADILDAAQENAFSAEALCRRIYPEIDPYELGSVQKNIGSQ
jgi:hypothetical protein